MRKKTNIMIVFSVGCMIWLVLVPVVKGYQNETTDTSNKASGSSSLDNKVSASSFDYDEESNHQVVVSKCCPIHSVLVETSLGTRSCQKLSDLDSPWIAKFYDLDTLEEIGQPDSYVLGGLENAGKCSKNETRYSVYKHEEGEDEMYLLSNGSLAHRLVHGLNYQSPWVLYTPDKYCIDNLVFKHNFSSNQEETVQFAYICIDDSIGLHHLIETYVYPIGLGTSIMCLVFTFLFYSFVPQLRDLTGKFILGICAFLATAMSLAIVEVFWWRDPNIQKLATEVCLHASICGIWLCLSCMGHHVWKIIRSRSVFTRVTDGTRLCYYTIFVLSSLATITAVSVTIHFLVGRGKGSGKLKISWECLTAFYVPMTVLLLLNLYFYITAQRRLSKQIVYNRGMQHFQVNFDLFVKFLIVLSFWWLFMMLSLLHQPALVYISMTFNVLVGPLVFCVAMCRTRVAFLFKKYFCYDSCCFGCCRSHDFIEDECKELSVIDGLRAKQDREDDALVTTSLLPSFSSNGSRHRADDGLCRSLFNVRHHGVTGEVPPPPDPEIPVGRVKRLLRSSSLNAIANINWGWRKETSV